KWFRIIPAKAWYNLSRNLVILAGLTFYLIDNNPSDPFNDGYKFFLPVLCGLIARIIGMSLSIINHAPRSNINRKIKRKCETKEPLVLWTDLHGDQPLGHQVIDAWIKVEKHEEEKRKEAGIHLKTPMPELPYIAKEIPIWADEHRSNVQRFIKRK